MTYGANALGSSGSASLLGLVVATIPSGGGSGAGMDRPPTVTLKRPLHVAQGGSPPVGPPARREEAPLLQSVLAASSDTDTCAPAHLLDLRKKGV